MTEKPLILIDPDPRNRAMILSDDAWTELNRIARVTAWFEGGRMPREMVQEHLPEATIIIGQTHLDAAGNQGFDHHIDIGRAAARKRRDSIHQLFFDEANDSDRSKNPLH